MKKLVVMLSLGFFFLALTPVSAEDVPYMEFIQKLRGKFPDNPKITEDYLEILEKTGPAELKDFIPLERASIRADQAASTLDAGVRNNLYTQARQDFDNFAKTKPNSPLAALARLEAARILGEQCRSAMTKLRGMDGNQAKGEATRIHDLAATAMTELEKASDEIAKQMKREKDIGPKIFKRLEQARDYIDFELAANKIDQGACYEAMGKGLAGGKLVEAAIKDLKLVAGAHPKTELGSLANAWLVRAHNEIDQTKDAKTYYDKLMADDGPHAEAGQRTGQFNYFMILANGRNIAPLGIKGADLPKILQGVGEEWIKNNPSHLNTFEGIALRYELAKSLHTVGKELSPKADVVDPKAKPYYERALKLYTELEDANTEFVDDIRNGKNEIAIAMAGSYNFDRKDIPTIKSFEQAMQFSQFEGTRIGTLAGKLWQLENKKDRNPAEEKEFQDLKKNMDGRRKQHLQNAEDLIAHALGLAARPDSKVKDKDVVEAKSTLCFIMMENGDLERAAVIGEHVAYASPNVAGAAKAATYALQAYAQLISGGPQKGLPQEIVDADRARFKKLVEYMENTWPNDSSTDAARHLYGTNLFSDKNYREAEKVLSRIRKEYTPASAKVSARYWQARAAQEVLKDSKEDKEKDYYQKAAIAALRDVPDLQGAVPPDVAQIYVAAKLQLGGILYDAKQWKELEDLSSKLVASIPQLKLDDDVKESMKHTAEALSAYAKFGRANAELAAGQPAKAIEMVDSVMPTIAKQLKTARDKVNEIRKPYGNLEQKAEEAAKEGKDLNDADKAKLAELSEKIGPYLQTLQRDGSLYRSLLLVSIRGSIMLGNKPRARLEVESLNKVAAEDRVAVHEYYKQLVGDIRMQIKDLTAKNEKDKLDKLVSSFVSFLDELVAKSPKLDNAMIFFLAYSYSSLDRPEEHIKAANLVGKIPEPKAQPPMKLDPKEEATWKFARLMYARELRLGKKFPEARKVLDEIFARDWGKGFDVRKEIAETWEDEEKYGAAAKEWSAIIGSFGPKPDFANAKTKENYFEARYNYIYCLYMFAKNLNDPKLAAKKPEYIKRSATLILQLESTPPGDMGGEQFKKRYDELLRKEEPLRKDYEALKKEKEKEKAAAGAGAAAK